MKMGVSFKCLIAVAFCLATIFVRSFGELIVLRHPEGNDDYSRELTCLSEDSDAALIWNYNPTREQRKEGQIKLTDFRPAKPLANRITGCAIWENTRCIAHWDREGNNKWEAVNSRNRPMAPVFDFRWEGFEELVFPETEFLPAGTVNESSGTAVFSARGSQAIYVSLCKNESLLTGPCVYVILGGLNGMTSAIKSCVDEVPDAGGVSNLKGCRDVAKVEHKASNVLDAYEWRTFTLKWDSELRTMKVFKEYDLEPFLEGSLVSSFVTWNSVAHIFVKSRVPSRIRFHFYEYVLTEHTNVELYTKELTQYRQIVRFKILVGLCSDCKLKVSLVNEEGHEIMKWTISRGSTFVYNELLTWQTVARNIDLKNVHSKSVKLVIRTILNNKVRKGRWAIDSFRVYESGDGIRESTISIGRMEQGDGSHHPPWSPVKCQKLSNYKSVVTDADSTRKYSNTSQLQEFLSGRKGSCGSMCANFGRFWYICDQTGCTCDRGFQGMNCNIQCPKGYHGYGCNESCASCEKDICDRTTGYCGVGCTSHRFLPPLCKTDFQVHEPIVTDITDTEARVFQKLEIGTDVHNAINSVITEVGSKTAPHINPVTTRNQTMYEVRIGGLKPDTIYRVVIIVTVTIGEWSGQVNSSEIYFTTTCNGKPRFAVSPADTRLTVTTASRGTMCKDTVNETSYYLEVSDAAVGTPKCTVVTRIPHTCSMLTPYTEYKVTITLDGRTLWVTKVRTLGLAPGEPNSLTSISQGHGIVELMWAHPSRSLTHQVIVKQFRIHVKRLTTKLRAIPDIKIPSEINHPISRKEKVYSIELNLLPSTTYNVSVVAISDQNTNSDETSTTISVPADVAFAIGEELRATSSGTSIKLEVPGVINATTNTTVTIYITELATDAQNQSRTSSQSANPTKCVATEYSVADSNSKNLMIDGDQNGDVASNCSLRLEGTYTITAVVKDLYSDSTDYLTSITITLTDNAQNLIWLIVFPIIAICLLILFLLWRKYAIRKSNEDNMPLSLTMTSTANSEASHIRHHSTTLPDEYVYEYVDPQALHISTNSLYETVDKTSIRTSVPDVIPYNPHSYSVKVEEFEEYTREAMASGLLGSQYELLPTELKKKYRYGRLPENLPKNRYKNLMPYDDTRVILKKIPGDPHSDYINASYMRGYRKERAYIATQGPLPNTVNDFWRMIWEENVHVVCMLTNITEDGKVKCEQYWPPVGTALNYGNILVSNTDHEVFADYTIRTLNLSYDNKDRKVTHLHYTGWPDHGVPMYSQSLVAYLKKLLEIHNDNGPVVVHCSAGIGRTGTIILCDICLRQADNEGMLDVPGVTVMMREDRADMVNSMQQYLLAHLAIMESMVYEQTQIPCNPGLPKKIKELRKQLPAYMQRLKDIVWQDRALHSLAVTRRSIFNDVATDRLSEFVPATPTVAEFSRDSIFDSESNYINAVSVDGVKMKKQYLESQLPTPYTLSEYWRLIAEKKIELVLILQRPKPNDPMCCEIMSSESILIPVPYIQVEVKSNIDDQEHFTIQKLLMTDTSEGRSRQQPVTVLKCTEWGQGRCGRPPTTEALVSLWMASEKISRKEAPTLVLCQDGVTGCGLYLALSFLLERMAVERECDVISAVRAVRRSRTEFVQSLEQFNYLYDAAVNYFECFQTYANFS